MGKRYFSVEQVRESERHESLGPFPTKNSDILICFR